MPWNWMIAIKIVRLLLWVLSLVPADADHQPIAKTGADIVDELLGQSGRKDECDAKS